MMARTLSRAACVSSSCVSVAPAAPFSSPPNSPLAALPFSLSVTCFSTSAQLPSSAETSSPLAAMGQFLRCQLGPAAFFFTSAGLSLSCAKKSRHCGSTELGSSS